jgi:predicted O-methyltransferase YrrM
MSFRVPPLVPQNIPETIADPRWRRGQFLESMVKRYGWTCGAELGVREGVTIGHLLDTCPGLHMVGVDLWEAQPQNAGPETYVNWKHNDYERVARARCDRHPGRFTLIKGRTVEAANMIENNTLDFVFVDADHSEQAVRDDIMAWYPKLHGDGWFFGHDINWPGVRAAVEDLLPDYLIGPNVVWFRPLFPLANWQATFKGA